MVTCENRYVNHDLKISKLIVNLTALFDSTVPSTCSLTVSDRWFNSQLTVKKFHFWRLTVVPGHLTVNPNETLLKYLQCQEYNLLYPISRDLTVKKITAKISDAKFSTLLQNPREINNAI